MARASQPISDPILERGLPASIDAERYVLGTVLRDGARFDEVRAALQFDDFSLEKHRRMFLRLSQLRDRGEPVDRIHLIEELMRHNQLEACDGMTYLVSLGEGLPDIINLDSYLSLVKEKSTLRKAIFASQNLINRALAGERPSDLQTSAEEVLLTLGTPEHDAGPQTPGEILDGMPGGINQFLNPHANDTGLKTGFHRLDELTGGFHPQELIIVAARPGQGKTSLVLNVAEHVAVKHNKPVVFFSLEMSKAALMTRLVCTIARVDLQRFRLGYVDAAERYRLQAATTQLADAPLYIDDKSAATLADLHSRVRRLMTTQPIALVVVDYLQLMSAGRTFESDTQEITAISRGLKLMAKEIGVPVIAISQLSRAPELRKGNPRPQLSDLRGSGGLEQDSDVVLFIFREELYKPDREDLRGQAELLLSKQRQGPTGKINLVFLHHLTKFENRVSDVPPPLSSERIGKDHAAQSSND